MKRKATKLGLARETLRKLVSAAGLHVRGGALGVASQSMCTNCPGTNNCVTNDCETEPVSKGCTRKCTKKSWGCDIG